MRDDDRIRTGLSNETGLAQIGQFCLIGQNRQVSSCCPFINELGSSQWEGNHLTTP
jgi:hypothetical protein